MTINSLPYQQRVVPARPTARVPAGGLDVIVQFVAQGKFPSQTDNQTIDPTGQAPPSAATCTGYADVNSNDATRRPDVQLAGYWQYQSEDNRSRTSRRW